MIIRRYRLLVFLFFTLSFFVVTGFTLLLMFGYQFSVERGIFIYSGSLTLKTTPTDVTLAIDGKEVPKNENGFLNRSYLVRGLLPGTHSVEVSAPGYHTWKKDFVTKSGHSTEFWNIFLTEATYGKEILDTSAFTQQIYPAPKSPTLALWAKQTPEGAEVDLVNTATLKKKYTVINTFPGFALTDIQSDTNIEWSADEKYALVPLQKDAQTTYAVLNLKNPNQEPFFLNQENVLQARWNPKTRDQIFALSGHTLSRISPFDNDQPIRAEFTDVLAFDLSNDYLYLLKSDGLLYRIPVNAGSSTRPLAITREALPLATDNLFSLIVYNNTRFTVLNKTTGSLWLYDRFGTDTSVRELLASGARGSQFSNDGKKLLYFSDAEIAVAFLRDWETQPYRARGDIQQLVRVANPLSFVAWHQDYEHVLFVNDNSLKLIELDDRDQRYLENLLSFSTPLLQLLPRFTENKLFFVESGDHNHPSQVSSLDFPKPEPGLLGL